MGRAGAIAHLDFTPVLWPYYVAAAAIYGVVTYLTNSIWPAIVLHTSGNLYSNFDLLLHGRAEWQAPSSGSEMVLATGIDEAFVRAVVSLVVAAAVMVGAYLRLAAAARGEVSTRHS